MYMAAISCEIDACKITAAV